MCSGYWTQKSAQSGNIHSLVLDVHVCWQSAKNLLTLRCLPDFYLGNKIGCRQNSRPRLDPYPNHNGEQTQVCQWSCSCVKHCFCYINTLSSALKRKENSCLQFKLYQFSFGNYNELPKGAFTNGITQIWTIFDPPSHLSCPHRLMPQALYRVAKKCLTSSPCPIDF